MTKILLRFRNTNDENDTIGEHQKIISTKGFTWWGWWKKSEPDRIKILNDIKQDLTSYDLYLFDRSTERFFSTKFNKIEFVENDKLPSPDINNTPAYYSNEKLPLWLSITEISEISKEKFLQLFSIIPTTDYSFFTENDIHVENNEGKSGNKRIKLNSDLILHLSDIHFGDDYGFPQHSIPNKRSLLDIILDYINSELKQQIGLLVISGDITSRGNSDILLTNGLTFLEELTKILGITKDAVIIIPGNHDIPLHNANFKDYNHETLFRIFMEKFYGYNKEPYGLEFFELPCGRKVDILRMHSVRLRKAEESNYGYVDWFLYRNLLAQKQLDGDLRIAVMHHHLVSTPIEETLDPTYKYGSISVTIDSGRVIEGLQKHNFQFVLNGHQHIPGITKISRGVISDQNEIDITNNGHLCILSAGSAGVKNERFGEQMKYNSFSVYKISKDQFDIDVRYYNPSLEPKRYYKSKIEI